MRTLRNLRRLTGLMATMVALAIASPARADEKADIVSTAAAAGQFRTLVTALVATDLVDDLKGKGPFTVFAPTDEAFAKLPKGTLQTLLKPENREDLAAILTYHVVAGSQIRIPEHPPRHRLRETETLNGAKIRFERNGSQVSVNGNRVVARNIACSNGIIQVIDGVLIPPKTEEDGQDIVAIAKQQGTFETLLAALEAADLTDALRGDGPFTVFTPTDEAFAKLPKRLLKSLLKPENKDALTKVLTYHVVAGAAITARDAVKAGQAETLQGQRVRASIEKGQLVINQSRVIVNDVVCSNGIIHVIDTVLTPPGLELGRADASKTANRLVSFDLEINHPLAPRVTRKSNTVVYDTSHDYPIDVDGSEAGTIVIRGKTAGSGSLINLVANTIRVELENASRIILEGRAGRVEGEISGAIRLVAFDLDASTADLRLDGASRADLRVTDDLKLETVAILGSGPSTLASSQPS